MHRVPVGASIAHAYEFLLQNLTNVLGTAWLPALTYAVGFYLFFQNMHAWMPVERQDLASAVLTGCTVVGAIVFTLMIRAVIGISLTQEALGVRKDFTLAHFVIGPRELRLFFGYVRFYLVALVVYLAVLAISVGAMYAAQHYGAGFMPAVKPFGFPLAVLGAALLTVVLFVWYVLAMLRLFFLLAAVASAEHHTRLAHAWSLTRHSTLRVLFVYLGTFLPLAAVAVIGLYFLIGPDQWAAAFQAAAQQKAGAPSALAPFYAAHAFVFAAAAGVLSLVGGALLAGAAAHAYRITTGHELAELEDDAALVAPLLEPQVVAPAVIVPAVVAPAVVEELPPPVHHDHGHEDHGLSRHEDEQRHHDHGHGDGRHNGRGETRDDDRDEGDAPRHDHHHGNGHHDHGHDHTDHGRYHGDGHAHEDHGRHAQNGHHGHGPLDVEGLTHDRDRAAA
jgi:hypothetical protein